MTDELRELLAWLDAYWTDAYGDAYSPRNIGGPDLQAAALHVRGYPVLIVVWSPREKNGGFVDILVPGLPRPGGSGVHLSAEAATFAALAAASDRALRPAPRL